MKLGEQSGRTRRLHSQEVLSWHATTEQSFYDPRIDFPPDKLQLIKSWVKDRTGEGKPDSHTQEKKDAIENYWWLSLIDRDFFLVLHSNPKIVDLFKDQAEFMFRHSVKFRDQLGMNLAYLEAPIQTFPELRGFFRKQYGDDSLPLFLENKSTQKLSDKLFSVIHLLQLYPEYRARFLDAYSLTKEEVIPGLKQLATSKDFLTSGKKIIAYALLVFPDLRPEILPIAFQFQSDWTGEFSEWNAFYTTIIGAKDAVIDSTGAIVLTFEPSVKLVKTPPLPERRVA